jgi:aminopeptidase N
MPPLMLSHISALHDRRGIDETIEPGQVQNDDDRIWELTIEPRPTLEKGRKARVEIRYSGDTTRPEDIEGALYGWVTTRDGAMVVGEPEGNMTWYPVSDHPTDTATYSFEITVPKGKVAVANGLQPRRPKTRGDWTTWCWDAPDPQASYLATASVGDFELRYSRTDDGLPIVDAVDRDLTDAQRATTDASLALQPEMIDLFGSSFGRYPFNSLRFDRRRRQRRLRARDPDTTRVLAAGQRGTVADELAHQWFGNAVSPGPGKTSGSMRAGPPTSSGCGARRRVVPPPTSSSTR